MNRIALTRPSVVPSEASVTGPHRPERNIVPFRAGTKNSDNPLTPQQLRPGQLRAVERTQKAVPKPVAEPAQTQKPKRSIAKMLTALAGVLMCSIGVVGGLMSIVALGPIGLAVAAGAGLLGAVLIKLGAKK